MEMNRGEGRQTVGLRESEKKTENKWTEKESWTLCLFLPVASAALMDMVASGQPQGNLGFSCFDHIKIDSSPQTPQHLYGG